MYNDPSKTGLLRKKDVEKALAERLEAEEKRHEKMDALTQPLLKEKKLALFILIGASLVNTFVLGIVDVIAVSGFISDMGIENLPWLWVGELTLSLLISMSVMQFIDKVSQVRMMLLLVATLFLTYLILGAFFLLQVSTKILYPLMYLVYAQQVIIFPMAFWNLANQVYSPSEAKKYFPMLSSGDLLGRLTGYSLFTLTGLLGYTTLSDTLIENPAVLMGFSAALYGIGMLAHSIFPPVQSLFPASQESTWVENIKTSYETINEVPFFRNVAALVAITWVALTLLRYNFYATLDDAAAQGLHFQTMYSAYNILVLLIPLIFQWTIGDDLLERISPKNGYFFLPVTILVGVGLAFFLTGFWGGVSAFFIANVVYRGWYLPLYYSLFSLVQAEYRGRVSSLLGNYSYLMGSLFAAIFIGITRLLLNLWEISAAFARTFDLVVALLAACGAIYIASRIRATYEDSLLSWRVARRKRTSSVLDQLD